ncbi:hypothetical protein [uncultured Jatrophihabitans sp.]|uniref:hypothetical protein n=1 Tax=uncultured Jatrophihabitans sp. TaxID=1610747 RepID=UPI0035CAB54A
MADHDRDRSSASGQFVSDDFADTNPNTTESEDVRDLTVRLTVDARKALRYLTSTGQTDRSQVVSDALVAAAAAALRED